MAEWTGDDDPEDLPEVTDEAIRRVLDRFQPLVQDKDQETYHTIEIPDYRRIAYSWDPTLVASGKFFRTAVPSLWLNFQCGYYGFFKPTIHEVASQVPEKFLSDEFYSHMNSWWIDPDTVIIYRSGVWQKALVHFGVFTPK